MVTDQDGRAIHRDEPTARDVAACLDAHVRFRDPVVDYADSDAANTWVDVRGKIDCINAPIEEIGLRPCTIHPAVSDTGEDVTRVWYEEVHDGE